jgi:hypothetical protein
METMRCVDVEKEDGVRHMDVGMIMDGQREKPDVSARLLGIARKGRDSNPRSR